MLDQALSGPIGHELFYSSGAGEHLIESQTDGLWKRRGVERLADRIAHMANQIHGTMTDVMAAVKSGDLPREFADKFRAVSNNLHKAEGEEFAVMEDPVWGRVVNQYLKVPQRWLDALQEYKANWNVLVPTDEWRGMKWEDFKNDMLSMSRGSAEAYNEGRAAHGKEGINPDLREVHPTMHRGTGVRAPMIGHLWSSVLDAGMNLPNALTGSAKGFRRFLNKGAVERMEASMLSSIKNSLREEGGIYYLPESWGAYLGTTEDGPKPKIQGVVESGPRKGQYIVGDERAKNAFLQSEPKRFAEMSKGFTNARTTDDAMILKKMEDFERKLPYLPGIHKASILDFVDEARDMATRGAALKAQRPSLTQEISDLASQAHDAAGKAQDPAMKARLTGIAHALRGGTKQDEIGRTSLAYRAYQQQRMVNTGSTNPVVNYIEGIGRALAPAVYDVSLNWSPTATAKQVGQNLGQAMVQGRGIEHTLGSLKQVYDNTRGFITRNKDLMISADPSQSIATGVGSAGFGQGSSISANNIMNHLDRLAGEVIENPNKERLLRQLYSDSEIEKLKAWTRDGMTDLSNPEIKKLANRIAIRYLEMTDGANLPTSKPAVFNYLPSIMAMFKKTPGTISAATLKAFTQGGLLDMGSTAKNLWARKNFAHVVAGWAIGRAASGDPIVISLLTFGGTGALFSAISQALRSEEVRGKEERVLKDSQVRNREINKILLHELVHGDLKARLKIAAAAGVGALQVPGVSADDVVLGSLLTDASKKALNINDKAGMSTIDVISAFAPSAGIPLQIGSRTYDNVSQTFSGEPGDKTTYMRTKGLLGKMLGPNSGLPYISDFTPLQGGRAVSIKGVKDPRQMDRQGVGAPQFEKIKKR